MSIIDDRLPPANIEAEEATLGSIMIDPEAIWDVQTIIEPADFYREQNRWVYQSMLRLQERQQPFDIIMISDDLRQTGQLEEMGGEATIFGLIGNVPTSINASHYASIVRAASLRRKMIGTASIVANMAFDSTDDENEPGDVDDLLDKAEHLFYAIRDETSRGNTRSAMELTKEYITYVEEMNAADGEIQGVPTGFVDLDKLIGGMQSGDLIVPAGRPSMGKTALMLSIAQHAILKEGKTGVIFSLEMSSQRLVERILSSMTRIDAQRLRRGNLDESDWKNFYHLSGQFSETGLFIDDTPSITPIQLRASARRLASRFGLDFIMVDYLQLMQAAKKHGNRVGELSEIGKSLKALGRELKVPVVAASQLSRAVEQRAIKRPMISDLRDSGTIEEDADQVWLMYRDEYYNPDTSERPNIAEVNCAKNRNGPTGIVDLYWQSQYATFRNLQRQEISL